MNPFFLYFIEKEIEKYEADPEHYKSYEEWGKELDEEYERCVEEIKAKQRDRQ
jgi:hypothetical protein